MRIKRVLLILLTGGLFSCAGTADDVARVAGSAVDDIARAVRVSDDLADDAWRAARSADELTDDAFRTVRLPNNLADDIEQAAAQNSVEIAALTDDVAYLNARVYAQAEALEPRIAQRTSGQSAIDAAELAALLKDLTCLYLDQRSPTDVQSDVAAVLDRSSIVDSPETRADIALAAYWVALQYNAENPGSLVANLYCNAG